VLGRDGIPSPGVGVRTVMVTNAPPRLGVPAITTAVPAEGLPVVVSATFEDPGTQDAPWTSRWEWDARGASFTPDSTATHLTPGVASASHVYAEPGTYLVRVQVTDKDSGASEVREVQVVVADATPQVERVIVSPESPSEGEEVELRAEVRDSPTDRVAQYRWDLDGDETVDAVTSAPVVRYTYADDAPGDGPIQARLLLEDEDGTTEHTFAVSVRNVPPTVSPVPELLEVAEGEALSLHLEAQDAAGEADPLRYLVAQGPEGLEMDAEGHVTWSPTAAQRGHTPGTGFPVVLAVEDDDGGRTEVHLTVRARSSSSSCGGCAIAGPGEMGALGVVTLVACFRRRSRRPQRSAMSALSRYGDASTIASAVQPQLVPRTASSHSPSVWMPSSRPSRLSTPAPELPTRVSRSV
jgi:PKD domain